MRRSRSRRGSILAMNVVGSICLVSCSSSATQGVDEQADAREKQEAFQAEHEANKSTFREIVLSSPAFFPDIDAVSSAVREAGLYGRMKVGEPDARLSEEERLLCDDLRLDDLVIATGTKRANVQSYRQDIAEGDDGAQVLLALVEIVAFEIGSETDVGSIREAIFDKNALAGGDCESTSGYQFDSCDFNPKVDTSRAIDGWIVESDLTDCVRQKSDVAYKATLLTGPIDSIEFGTAFFAAQIPTESSELRMGRTYQVFPAPWLGLFFVIESRVLVNGLGYFGSADPTTAEVIDAVGVVSTGVRSALLASLKNPTQPVNLETLFPAEIAASVVQNADTTVAP